MAAEIPVIRLAAGETRAVDAALLARTHADGLAVLGVADGVRLGVFERDERNDHVALRIIRKGLIFGDDVLQKGLVDLEVVASLLEGNAEDVLLFLRGGNVGGVDLYDVVLAALFRLQDSERLLAERGGDDAVGDLAFQIFRRRGVALVGERRPVAVGAEAIRAAGADIGAGNGRKRRVRLDKIDLLVHLVERQAERRARGGNVLETRRSGKPRRLLQLAHELEGVESVEQVDVAGLTVQNGEGQVAAVFHKDARGLLVGVAAVFEFELVHIVLLNRLNSY